MRAAVALTVMLAAVGPVRAATFVSERLTDGRVALHMHGVIQRGDEAKLAEAVRRTPAPVLLLLESPGGDAWTSLEIARTNPLPTEVRTGEACLSACATVWVTARHRYIESAASVGFHQISQTVEGKLVPVPWATSIVAEWYRQLGFGPEAIRRMTSEPPTGMHWIDDTDAANGIAFAPRQTTSGTPIVATAASDHTTSAAAPVTAKPYVRPFGWLDFSADEGPAGR